MAIKNDKESPEVWEDWDDSWADDYLDGMEFFGEDSYEDHSNIASLGGDYYKMFLSSEKNRNS
jgi:hypothetical protein